LEKAAVGIGQGEVGLPANPNEPAVLLPVRRARLESH
jgi:hypothetical protein